MKADPMAETPTTRCVECGKPTPDGATYCGRQCRREANRQPAPYRRHAYRRADTLFRCPIFVHSPQKPANVHQRAPKTKPAFSAGYVDGTGLARVAVFDFESRASASSATPAVWKKVTT